MDPLTVIISALSLAGTALQPITDQAIKDGYAGLKALLIRKFGGAEPELAPVLDQHERRPDVYTPAAENLLRAVGADRDQEVVDAATALLKHAEQTQPGISGGLVGQINAQGGQVAVVQGNVHGGIHMGAPETPRE
jgi:hypothetical protein